MTRRSKEDTNLLMTVIVRPNARLPYGNKVLYTLQCSKVLTIAKGVQGRIALTREPSLSESEAMSVLASETSCVAPPSLRGSTKRALWYKEKSLEQHRPD